MYTRIYVNNLTRTAPYYSRRLSDVLPDTEYVFIQPIAEDHNELAYRVEVHDDKKLVVGGEGYYVTDTDSLKRHKVRAERAAEGKTIIYHWCSVSGNTILTTRTNDEFLFVYSMVNKDITLSDAAAMLELNKQHCDRNDEDFHLGGIFVDTNQGGFRV